MPAARATALAALAGSLALHLLVILVLTGHLLPAPQPRERPGRTPVVVALTLPPLLPVQPDAPEKRPAPSLATPTAPAPARAMKPPAPDPAPVATPARAPASQAAPPAPTAQEWAFAAGYTLKNSKGYRYTWGQQIRSMMGTATEGPDQGHVRFRVEIAPDGSLARLDTLWSTSPVAERLARQAIASMPRWPPTPTGQPLVFERTIAFTPFATDDPPLYKDDCQPDPPAFRNPFAWDGASPRDQQPATAAATKPDPQALAECMRQLPRDTIEAETARDRRLMERWGPGASGR